MIINFWVEDTYWLVGWKNIKIIKLDELTWWSSILVVWRPPPNRTPCSFSRQCSVATPSKQKLTGIPFNFQLTWARGHKVITWNYGSAVRRGEGGRERREEKGRGRHCHHCFCQRCCRRCCHRLSPLSLVTPRFPLKREKHVSWADDKLKRAC